VVLFFENVTSNTRACSMPILCKISTRKNSSEYMQDGAGFGPRIIINHTHTVAHGPFKSPTLLFVCITTVNSIHVL